MELKAKLIASEGPFNSNSRSEATSALVTRHWLYQDGETTTWLGVPVGRATAGSKQRVAMRRPVERLDRRSVGGEVEYRLSRLLESPNAQVVVVPARSQKRLVQRPSETAHLCIRKAELHR